MTCIIFTEVIPNETEKGHKLLLVSTSDYHEEELGIWRQHQVWEDDSTLSHTDMWVLGEENGVPV